MAEAATRAAAKVWRMAPLAMSSAETTPALRNASAKDIEGIRAGGQVQNDAGDQEQAEVMDAENGGKTTSGESDGWIVV